jgi:hypothetical protein
MRHDAAVTNAVVMERGLFAEIYSLFRMSKAW